MARPRMLVMAGPLELRSRSRARSRSLPSRARTADLAEASEHVVDALSGTTSCGKAPVRLCVVFRRGHRHMCAVGAGQSNDLLATKRSRIVCENASKVPNCPRGRDGACFAPSRAMRTSRRSCMLFTSMLAVCVWGCGSSDEETPPASCSVVDQTGCKAGETCETTSSGQNGCFASITLKGKVIDATGNTPIVGAHVVARDENGAAIADVAVTDANGVYMLVVPATRDEAGTPLATKYTLRADAAGYDAFPGGLRVALPLDVRIHQRPRQSRPSGRRAGRGGNERRPR
jgi:hypothetical protein